MAGKITKISNERQASKTPSLSDKKQRKSKFPLLIFFPNIAIGEKFTNILQKYLPDEKMAFVSSKSEERSTIVEKFREKELSILVTTTILERGVTFPQVDVFVCMANHHLYTSSSLIQIGGRVGRSQIDRQESFISFMKGYPNQCFVVEKNKGYE